ncbi:pyrroline-5-carboxylate reductase [Corynebacterium sp. 320]|uniref:pyrroline-5-carboxylate reductase n=1 Tax=Corynebacterium TaxID=1716 RepID=UPI00125CBE93|nr:MULTISPECIES: pyrroline-5-carboxylate reductase [Corynebacterium]KAB1504426.1 pyrroline-5-carboxylate reductase [Corynebacterium sp. 320]KAB1552475.1 pyrroline-5-carboxylate reductase [Corynebacterium sp. 321]KAB1554310.1 pyrroline-5-carboxylate reductase [Corynebacterium sp. 319]KAB3528562.1 pyrroline-5-carboxylate reductase [Corynebacterium sp. 250]KAB3539946.1 pyrroline-5-carboxylate reductase [Corynebacterium sp. 366]
MTRIGIIGGGNIGEALISGVISGGVDAKHVVVSDPAQPRREELRERYGVVATDDATEVAEEADFVVIAVKPDVVGVVLKDIADTVSGNSADTVVVSVAAGVSIGFMESQLAAGTPVVRVMPNTPMLVGKGASGIAGGRHAEDTHLQGVKKLMENTGRALIVKEKDLDAVTAVSGSGPAYFFLVVEAMTDAGVQLGLPRPVAEELAVSTAAGSAAMLERNLDEDDGDDANTLRTKVTSPGGTTAAATRALEENGLRKAFFQAMQACRDRSVELGQQNKED